MELNITEVRNRGRVARFLITFSSDNVNLKVYRDRERKYPVKICNCNQGSEFNDQLSLKGNITYKIAIQKPYQSAWKMGDHVYLYVYGNIQLIRRIDIPFYRERSPPTITPSIAPDNPLMAAPPRPQSQKRSRPTRDRTSDYLSKSEKMEDLLEKYRQIDIKRYEIADLNRKLFQARDDLARLHSQTSESESEIYRILN